MSIKSRINIIVFLSVITIAGLYAYIVKITLDIDHELTQVERIEEFEENVSQIGLITEYYLSNPEERYTSAWFRLINNIDMISEEIDDFSRYHIVRESIPSIRNAFELVVQINEEPELYPNTELRTELLNRASTRIQSDVRQLMTISYRVSMHRLENIRTLQVVQRLDFLKVLIPFILALILLAYFMRRVIISSFNKIQEGAHAFATGNLDQRIDLKRDDELGELTKQFNEMAEALKKLMEREKSLNLMLEQQAEELKASNQELESFASVASHDLKEPLRMIRSFMELLGKKYGDELDENAKKYIHFAVDGSQRMTNLINDLLEFSRVGKRYTEIENVDVNRLIDEVLQFYEPQIEGKKAVIKCEPMPEVKAVPVSLKMVFQNLVSNALKYHEDGASPVINIQVKELENFWQFSVADNGIGISGEYLDQIFQLFKRLYSSDKYPGTGMGLATCKKIVEQHGGTIWVDSEKGEGSTFYFTLVKEITSTYERQIS